MAEFVLFLYDDPSAFADVTPQDMQAVIKEYGAWAARMRDEGRFVHGQKLMDEGGRHLIPADGDVRVVDGPYSETKEIIGGFFQLKADSYDEAVAIAKTCPHVKYGAKIELRQVHLLEAPVSA